MPKVKLLWILCGKQSQGTLNPKQTECLCARNNRWKYIQSVLPATFLYLQVMNVSGYSGKNRQERKGKESCSYLSVHILYEESSRQLLLKIRESPRLQEKSCCLCLKVMEPWGVKYWKIHSDTSVIRCVCVKNSSCFSVFPFWTTTL